jgi:hypothetical protein
LASWNSFAIFYIGIDAKKVRDVKNIPSLPRSYMLRFFLFLTYDWSLMYSQETYYLAYDALCFYGIFENAGFIHCATLYNKMMEIVCADYTNEDSLTVD